MAIPNIRKIEGSYFLNFKRKSKDTVRFEPERCPTCKVCYINQNGRIVTNSDCENCSFCRTK